MMNKDKYIFRKMLEENGLSLSGRDDIGLYEIIAFIMKYEAEGIVKYEDGHLALTIKGMHYLAVNRKTIFLSKTKKEWEEIPPEYLGKHIDINKHVGIKLKGDRHTSR